MAKEIRFQYEDGYNLYAIVRRPSDGYIWDVGDTAFEAVGTWNDARVGECDIALTGYNGELYMADFPATAAGRYIIFVYLRAGDNPAITDEYVSGDKIVWSGSAEVYGFETDGGLVAAAIADVLAQATLALTNNNLDHFMKVACGADDVVNNTALAKLVSKDATADWSDYVNTTESLEALKDGILATIATDAARLTAVRAAVLTDLIDGGRLDLILDIIAADTTTDIPALIATAQSDLDIITGASGVVIQDGTVKNASFAADVGSTAYATNIIALAVRKALDELNLDHLMKIAVADRDALAEVVDDTVLANIMTKTDGDTSDFDHATDSLEALRDSRAPHAGGLEITYTVRVDDEDTGDLLEGVSVWISTDISGSNVIWSGATNSSGVLVDPIDGTTKPRLDAGTYYFWRQKSGYTFSDPDTETFS